MISGQEPVARRLLLADDHPVFRSGLRNIVERDGRFLVSAEAPDGMEALRLLEESPIDIAILDVEMPRLNGLEVARKIYEKEMPTRVLILTMFQEESIFDRAMDYGVTGYLLKDSAAEDIVKALVAVERGEYFISPALTRHVISTPQADPLTGGALRHLTPTEHRVLALIAQPKSTREIAGEMNISLRTVENHRAHICAKLGLAGTYSLLRFALTNREWIMEDE